MTVAAALAANAQPTSNVTDPQSRLRIALSAAIPKLEAISDAAAAASNNHERFVRAQFTNELICSTYEQDAWVLAQRYRDAPWNELISLWGLLNLHLARVMAAIPDAIRNTSRTRHNLDRVAFRVVSASEPVTLELFMHDYVVHLEHHLTQILQPADAR